MTAIDDLSRFKGWKTCQLGDCVNFLSGGTPSKKKPEYWDGNIPWVSCKDMKRSYLYDSQDHLTEEGAANGTRLVSPETILIVVRGMILGQHFPVAIAKRKMAFNQDLKALECAPHVDQKFLFHWLQGKSYEILGIADEAAHGTKRLQTDRLQNFPLYLPPLPIQRKIAAILSAYDDLIENNTRRIEILEEMARSLYRQWFINFRFPGHEQVKMVDSEMGLIPEGWEITSIGNHINTQKGYAFKSSWYQEEGIKIVKVSDFTDDSIDITKLVSISEEIAEQYKKHELEANDIIIQTVGSWASNPQSVVGKVIRVPKIAAKALLNQNAVKVITKESINQVFLFYTFKNERFKSYIIGCAQGAASQASITLDAIREFKILLPPSSLLDSLEDFVSPMWKLINNLENKNLNIRCTRDYLLPKLISGEIDVENLDINAGEIAA